MTGTPISLATISSAAAAPSEGHRMHTSRETFGVLADGRPIEIVTLRNTWGISVKVITLGAAMQSLTVPGRAGQLDDVLLGYDTAADYMDRPQYFGATIGRFANRIGSGRFELDGVKYQLETNDGPNHLHGGVRGFDRCVWTIDSVDDGPEPGVVMSQVSLDGDSGYPGELRITATFTLNDRNEVGIAYCATTTRPTIVNLTNHNFYNLGGVSSSGDIYQHLLTIPASAITPVDAALIPTGALQPVANTPFDFRTRKAIGAHIRDAKDEQIRFGRGYDHTFIVDGAGHMRVMARLEDQSTGRVMELLSAAPGLQVYSGNSLDGTVIGKGGQIYRQGDAICLEPQIFPDSPNKPDFPSARLDPGQAYENRMILRFSISDDDIRGSQS